MSHIFRQIRLFISSTFRDMNAERDYLVQFTFPRLLDYCHSRHLDFVPIDLRWGIPEEDSRNGLVLSACLEEIDNSRPFFIGILGSRYGWQPSLADLQILPASLEHMRPRLHDEVCANCSITEMEIEYGVLQNMDIPYASFFIRDENVKIPAEYREKAGSIADGKLKALKSRLRNQSRYPVSDYATPEELGQMVYEQVISMINAEYPPEADNEYESVTGTHLYALDANGYSLIDTDHLWNLFEQRILDHTKIVFLGGSEGAENLHTMAYLINRLVKKYQEVHYFDFEYAPEGLSPIAAFLQWARLELKPLEKPTWRYVGIDHCSLLNVEEARQLSDWIKEQPESTYIAVAGTDYSPIFYTLYWRFYPQSISCNSLVLADQKRFIANYTQRYGKRLTADQLAAICEGKNTSDPAILELVCRVLVNFGSIEGLNNRIKELVNKQKYTSEDLLISLFSEIEQQLIRYNKATNFTNVMMVLSMVHGGILERELMSICKIAQSEWSIIRPYILYFCKKCGSRISFVYDYWREAVFEIWVYRDSSFRARVAYDMVVYYLQQLSDDKFNVEAARKLYIPLFNYCVLDGRQESLFSDIHAICLSPEMAMQIPASEYAPLWELLYRRSHGITEQPIRYYGKTIEDLDCDEAIAYYQKLASVAEDLNHVNDVAWAYEHIAEYKKSRGDRDYVLCHVKALLSTGRIHLAIEILNSFEKSIRKSSWHYVWRRNYDCSDEIVLCVGLLRCRAFSAIGKHHQAVKDLISYLDYVNPSNWEQSNLFIEAKSMILCIALEHNLEDNCFKFKDKVDSKFLKELPMTSRSLAMYCKAKMLTFLYRDKNYNQAEIWADFYVALIRYNIGAGARWRVSIIEGHPLAFTHAQIYKAYAQFKEYGKQNVLNWAFRGKLLPIQYAPRLSDKNIYVDDWDKEYRLEMLKEARRFRKMLTEIEESSFREYNKIIPQQLYDEGQAELEDYRKKLRI